MSSYTMIASAMGGRGVQASWPESKFLRVVDFDVADTSGSCCTASLRSEIIRTDDPHASRAHERRTIQPQGKAPDGSTDIRNNTMRATLYDRVYGGYLRGIKSVRCIRGRLIRGKDKQDLPDYAGFVLTIAVWLRPACLGINYNLLRIPESTNSAAQQLWVRTRETWTICIADGEDSRCTSTMEGGKSKEDSSDRSRPRRGVRGEVCEEQAEQGEIVRRQVIEGCQRFSQRQASRKQDTHL